MQYDKAKKFITQFLKTGISSELYYHNYPHTMDVVEAAEKLAKAENIVDETDLLLLKTAALFHDCGFVNIYVNHEEESCRIARNVLPDFDYTKQQIDIICEMIMKTHANQIPQTHLEKILCDADLDYLGRDDFELIGNSLFKEWKKIGKVKSRKEWNQMQIRFLESHKYLTSAAINSREKKKEEHLLKLKNNL